MKRTLAALAVSATFAAVLVPVAVAAPARSIYMCQERQPGPRPCVWDARHMGNGAGASYIIRQSGYVDYISHEHAHRLFTQGF